MAQACVGSNFASFPNGWKSLGLICDSSMGSIAFNQKHHFRHIVKSATNNRVHIPTCESAAEHNSRIFSIEISRFLNHKTTQKDFHPSNTHYRYTIDLWIWPIIAWKPIKMGKNSKFLRHTTSFYLSIVWRRKGKEIIMAASGYSWSVSPQSNGQMLVNVLNVRRIARAMRTTVNCTSDKWFATDGEFNFAVFWVYSWFESLLQLN